MNTNSGLIDFLKSHPVIKLGEHPVLGKMVFNVVRSNKDNKDRMAIAWEQSFSNSVNKLKGRTILYETISGELKVVNTIAEQNLADIAGVVVNMLADKFNLTTNYDRRNPYTFTCEKIIV